MCDLDDYQKLQIINILNNVAYKFDADNETEKAIKCLKFTVNCCSVEAMHNLAVIYYRQNNIEETIKYYESRSSSC